MTVLERVGLFAVGGWLALSALSGVVLAVALLLDRFAHRKPEDLLERLWAAPAYDPEKHTWA